MMTRGRVIALVLATAWLPLPLPLYASDIVDQNPFDPGRKPWPIIIEAPPPPPPPPPLPELTPKDLQIEAIIAFGTFRGIIAQLDGSLKGALPANAAGKVRIQVGQNVAGYVLADIQPNHVDIQAGPKRFTVPLLRKVSKGGAPAPALAVPAPSPNAPPAPAPAAPPGHVAAPTPMAAAGAAPAFPTGVAPAGMMSPFGTPPGQPAGAGASDAPAQAQQPAQQQEQAQQPAAQHTGQPTSLLDAIRNAQAAQEAARAAQSGTAAATPFFGKP